MDLKERILAYMKESAYKPLAEEELGEAIAYMGVKDFPARIKCATLSWKALEKAISEVEENGK